MPKEYQARFWTTACAGLLASVIAGCAGPSAYEIRGQAAPMINRNSNGAPLSVVVKLYQLKNREAFNKLSFDLATSGRSDNELFGDDLLGKSELIVVPGRTYVGDDKVQAGAGYIGVVAHFRRPDPHYWRYLLDADTVRSKGLNFKVQECYLLLDGIKAVEIPGQPQGARPNCGGQRSAFGSKYPASRPGSGADGRELLRDGQAGLREARDAIRDTRETLEEARKLKNLAIGSIP